LPDAKGLFDAAALVSFSQPAGKKHALDRDFCVGSPSSFPAFVVGSQDSRVELREFTHSPTFVFRAAFNFTFNVSDLHMFSSVPGGDSMILQSVSDSIMDALQDVLGARNGTVFVISGEEYYSYDSVSLPTKKVHERSGYVAALNSSGMIRHPYDQPFHSFFADQVNLNHLTNLAINIFHQKMPYNPTMRNLVSSESLQVCFCLPIITTSRLCYHHFMSQQIHIQCHPLFEHDISLFVADLPLQFLINSRCASKCPHGI
jgi:hypothetical protein